MMTEKKKQRIYDALAKLFNTDTIGGREGASAELDAAARKTMARLKAEIPNTAERLIVELTNANRPDFNLDRVFAASLKYFGGQLSRNCLFGLISNGSGNAVPHAVKSLEWRAKNNRSETDKIIGGLEGRLEDVPEIYLNKWAEYLSIHNKYNEAERTFEGIRAMLKKIYMHPKKKLLQLDSTLKIIEDKKNSEYGKFAAYSFGICATVEALGSIGDGKTLEILIRTQEKYKGLSKKYEIETNSYLTDALKHAIKAIRVKNAISSLNMPVGAPVRINTSQLQRAHA